MGNSKSKKKHKNEQTITSNPQILDSSVISPKEEILGDLEDTDIVPSRFKFKKSSVNNSI